MTDRTAESAAELDAADPLAAYRGRFRIPVGDDGIERIYLAGQSLGAQPVAAAAAVQRELDSWARLGVDGHFHPGATWVEADGVVREMTARLVGARPSEIATMNTLTVNLHMLLASFYRPRGRRTAILIDAPTFPSDRYAVELVIRHHGLDPATDLVVVRPRAGEALIEPSDLEAAIEETGDRLAVTLLAGVNYATGQVHDIARTTGVIHEVGGLAGWDLAHSAGNVPLALDTDDVDFAAWCTYKYLNSGPGAVAQVFVHDRHGLDPATPRLSGWWGNDLATRFKMGEAFQASAGAEGWRVSNPPILSLAPIGASLAIFDEVGMAAIREKSVALTGWLERLIDALVPDATILTPRDPDRRGTQLSVRLPDARRRLHAIEAAGVTADFREPDIIRLAPVPLYNTYTDAWRAATALAETAP